MAKFVAYEKLSKKKKKEVDALRRATWGAMSPVTRRPEKSGVYNRKKHRSWMTDADAGVFLLQKSRAQAVFFPDDPISVMRQTAHSVVR